MLLNARVHKYFARIDVNFQMVTVTQLCNRFFFILILLNIRVPLILRTKFQPNIAEIDLNARVDVNFVRVNVNFQTVMITVLILP